MRIPVATYRFQFHPGFRLRDATALVDYLHELGISDLYASPLYQARKGSTHGYDVVNPTCLNPQVGSEEDLEQLSGRLRERGMGLLLDTVPNHMAANEENPWWRSVLENGIDSPYASYFDIDWSPLVGYMQNKVLVPLLGGAFGSVLEKGELKLQLEEGHFSIAYYDRRFPCYLKTYPLILRYRFDPFHDQFGADHHAVLELKALIDLFQNLGLSREDGYLPTDSNTDPVVDAKRRLVKAMNEHPVLRDHLQEIIRIINGKRGNPASFNFLESLLDEQCYRLSFWKIANEEINYRRFFNISDLICMRIEKEEVFETIHKKVLQWISEGKVTGLRIDHVDGLYDPFAYLRRLQERIVDLNADPSVENPFYIIVEKILALTEELPHEWPVHGTSGYDFLTYCGGVFIDREGLQKLNDLYAWVGGSTQSFQDMIYDKKKLVMNRLFAGEIQRLRSRLLELVKDDRYAKDLSSSQLANALVEVTACMPVYRNYVRENDVSPRDIYYIEHAIQEAKRRVPTLNMAALDFLKRLFLLRIPETVTPPRRRVWRNFVMRWQQFTGPLTAKGLEDTSLYIYNRLVSLNDVGGEPDAEHLTLEFFHQQNARRRDHWPHSMNATSTHDTKRSEDVRARIHVLSEIPDEWASYLHRWFEWNAAKKKTIRGIPVPTGNEEYLLYQTMLGFWPLMNIDQQEVLSRLKDYMVKAGREAKVHTSWMRPDEAYESALRHFMDRILENPEQNEFYGDFLGFYRRIAFYGAINSLSQVLIKLVAPGLPDIYQGSEFWDFSLVDPDNRRPVNYSSRLESLAWIRQREIEGILPLVQELLSSWMDGRIKMYLTYRALRFRKENPELFQRGDYTPLYALGPRANHLCAFSRRVQNKIALLIVPRLVSQLIQPNQYPTGEEIWQNTRLELPQADGQHWRNILTDEIHAPQLSDQSSEAPSLLLGDLFRTIPFALLSSE